MRATVQRTRFAEALKAMGPAIPTRPNVPILAAIHLSVQDGVLTLSATDYEIGMKRVIEVEADQPGTAAVSGLMLRDLITKLKGGTVSIELDGDALVIAAGRSNYRLQCFPVADYPTLPSLPEKVGEVSARGLAHISRAVAHAASTDPTLATTVYGIYLEVVDGRLYAAATDRFKIAGVSTDWTGGEFAARLDARHIAAVTTGLSGTLAVHTDGNRVGFTGTEGAITVSSFEGEFVQWRRVVTQNTLREHEVDRLELIEALDRASLTLERDIPVVMVFEDELLTLTSRDDLGSGVETVDVVGTEPHECRINPVYLGALLNSIGQDRVSIGTGKATQPLIIHGINADQSRDEGVHLVMPVRAQK